MTKKRPAKKTESLELRIDPDTKERFQAACREEGKAASAVIRDYVTAYADGGRRAFTQAKENPVMHFLRTTRGRLAALGGSVMVGAAAISGQAAADPALEAIFKWFDRDGDEALSETEFLAAPASAESPMKGLVIDVTSKDGAREQTRDKLFASMDRDSDGKIVLSELQEAVTVSTMIKLSVASADQDGDGKLSLAELAAQITAGRAAKGSEDAARGTVLMAKGIIRAQDADGDGYLDADEL